MANDFDKAAKQYDTAFTHSVIGKAQRKRVYALLSEVLKKQNPKKILEINCGTGEDAFWLARQNYEVVATDISEAMIAVAQSKSDTANPVFFQADINDLPHPFSGEQFDLIFSNFGGLNCLSEIRLELFFKNAAELLSENGQLVLVIMPKNTKWEQFYFLAKANFQEAFRRKSHSAIANVDGQSVLTYYHNPSKTAALASGYFDLKTVHPIGFFVPPSYLEPHFSKKQKLVSFLDSCDIALANSGFLARHADHYLINLQKR
ncbi:class I SAM-dependent methyltransferase [Flavobacterium sp.]|uniref:class I SAM-dependent methyltransferase n=1 Tax=Flavobacterium sp. TaxID=239 RepID=UPI0039E3F8AC